MKQFLKEQRGPDKTVLFIGNAPSYPRKEELHVGNIFIKFVQPNIMSLLQPMDQGVVKATTKRLY